MAKHPELCLILLSLLVTFLSNYGSSFKSKPMVVPAKPPEALFPVLSSVLDLYLGELDPLVDLVRHEDLVFVMYYAPWCAKSNAATDQFAKAAKFMEGQVRFVAVNCWYPEGPCRKQYKFLLYPVFFAYHKNNDGYRYMGIERAEFMVKFLEDLRDPLTWLRDITDVQDFVVQHDSVVAGYFDFNSSPQPPGFQQFFYASMRVVEHDPHQPVKFGVVTDPALAALYHMKQPSDIVHLRINNSSLKFPWENNITSSNLVKWVFAGRQQLPVRWVVPLGMKSLALSREINKGPAVIMFHRVSPLSVASQSFSVFKDLALRYSQCPGDRRGQETSYRWLSLSLRSMLQQVEALQSCQQRSKGRPSQPHSVRCCISTAYRCIGCVPPEARFNICEICQHWASGQRSGVSVCSFEAEDGHPHDSAHFTHLPVNSCQNSIHSYDVSSRTSVCCKWCEKNVTYSDFLTAPFYASPSGPETSYRRRPTDRYVLDSLEQLPRKLCDRFSFEKSQRVFPSVMVADVGRSGVPEGFTGRGCGQNRSLTFLTMDSQNHWMFAERLGLDVSQAHVSPVVVAFDKEQEEQHVLHGKFSKKNTAMFIMNFTQGRLRRELRTLPPVRQEGCGSSPSLCVRELTTATLPAALNQPQDLVLLVYAGWCGFCTALSHVFLHLAHYFHTSPTIAFARINGETNDLPWELTMESYPTIIFFPAHREADSVAFPDTFPPSLPNLIRFVLQHATFATRFHLAADVCSPACVRENLVLAKHALVALRAKLLRLDMRRKAIELAVRSGKGSGYHLEAEKILSKRMGEVSEDIRDARSLVGFLEESVQGGGGGRLDQAGMQRLLREKMERKDWFVGR